MADMLVVEDDETVAEVVVDYLRRNGHTAESLGDGRLALDRLATVVPDLVILDVMLPGLDGLAVCAALRRSHPDLPIIMLTALSGTEDRIAGLEMGADDYLSKPFSPRELALRVDSVLRRNRTTDPGLEAKRYRAGDLLVDAAARRVTRDGREIALTARELDVLIFLMRNPGQAFSREELMREIWGWTYGDRSTVTVHVRRIREKVEPDPLKPTLIQTVWGVGYRLEMPS